MYCQNCGQQIPDNANFCRKCGAKVEKIIAPPPPSQTHFKRRIDIKSNNVKYVVGIFALGILVAIIILGMNRNPQVTIVDMAENPPKRSEPKSLSPKIDHVMSVSESYQYFEPPSGKKAAVSIIFGGDDNNIIDIALYRSNVYEGYEIKVHEGYEVKAAGGINAWWHKFDATAHWNKRSYILADSDWTDCNFQFSIDRLDKEKKIAVVSFHGKLVNNIDRKSFVIPQVTVEITGKHFDSLTMNVSGKQEEKKQESDRVERESQELRNEKEEAKYYTGNGPVKIAVVETKLKRSTGLHSAKGSGTFVYISLSAKNFGHSTCHVNPNDFTLTSSNGATVSHESDTYNLGNYFDAVDLNSGQHTSGWLIFYLEKDNRYTLNYHGLEGSAQKAVIP